MTPKYTDTMGCAALPYIQNRTHYRYIPKNACRENYKVVYSFSIYTNINRF